MSERPSNSSVVAQVGNLAYRRQVVGWRGEGPSAGGFSTRERADCPSALRRSAFRVRRCAFPLRAFTLIELIAVVAAIALLASALVPALIRHLDRIAGERESAALKSFGDALQQSIRRNRYIPSDTNWASTVATELGADVADVMTSPRKQPRFFLIDASLNSWGLPYTQTSAGSTNRPVSPRVMIVSSMGRALPGGIVSGPMSSGNFNAMWDWNDGGSALPATSFAWTGWPNAEDLKVQRVNLSSLFVRLLLNTNHSNFKSFYSVDAGATNVVAAAGIDRYFIPNSTLFLYGGQTNLDSQRILLRDTSFVYDEDIWRDSIGGRSGSASSVAGLDFGSIVDQYLRAPENLHAFYTLTNNLHGNTNISVKQQWIVVSNMMAYLSAYTNWANSNFASSNETAVVTNQQNMVDAVRRQYDKVGSDDHLPTPYFDWRCQ